MGEEVGRGDGFPSGHLRKVLDRDGVPGQGRGSLDYRSPFEKKRKNLWGYEGRYLWRLENLF